MQKVTVKLLQELDACKGGIRYFKVNYKEGITANELLIQELDKGSDYVEWIMRNLLIKDNKEIRDRITNSYHAYLYCETIKDRKEIRGRITDSYWLSEYNEYVKGRS